MQKIIVIGIIGYLIGLIGFLGGTVFSAITSRRSARFHGALMGFTAGLLIAFVCFEMLPAAFENQGLSVGIVGIVLGVIVSAWLEGWINKLGAKASDTTTYKLNYIKMGVMLCAGVMLHKMPEGLAVGALLNYNFAAGISMAIIIAVHCFPEAVAVAVPLREGGLSYGKIAMGCFLICLPMGIGSIIGAALSGISAIFISLCLAFSGGVMIYITCGEMIPESKDIWSGRLSTLGASAGFVFGVIMTAKM